jgi:hypothetical protein
MTLYGIDTCLPERMVPVKQDRHHMGVEKQDAHSRPVPDARS